jgi:hypothetical protein
MPEKKRTLLLMVWAKMSRMKPSFLQHGSALHVEILYDT